MKSNRDFISCRVTHIEQSSRTRLSRDCNENRALASTRMKRRIAESVSIFLVYIMFARVNRNSRNYKARASRAFLNGYTIHSYGARSSSSLLHRAALIERLPASGVPSATLELFFIAILAHYRAVDTSPVNSWHHDARINSS